MKIIFYELNEVSWPVIDYFIGKKSLSTLGQILPNAHQYTTFTHDSGELHPWTTWPTVHRGVYNEDHQIKFLNQDVLTSKVPFWEILAKNFKDQNSLQTIGIFGSLQTTPIKNLPDPDKYAFYVPDTFASTSHTLPKALENFQSINLSFTQRDGGTTPKEISLSLDLLKKIVALFRQGLTVKTCYLLGSQLIKEKLNPIFKTIRSIYQAPFTFDFYYNQLKTTQPAFSTFFTNHVAGMMHRYWKYTFPKEFSYILKGSDDDFRAQNIFRSLKIADQQLKKLKKFADSNNYILMIGSSMGQEAISRGEYQGELRISNMQKFYKAIGYNRFVENNLAMNPDFSFRFKNTQDLEFFQNRVAQLKDHNNQDIFSFKQSKLTLNCNLFSDGNLIQQGQIFANSKPYSFDHFGITVEMRDQGTRYHQPKGIWIVYHKNLKPYPSRSKIESIQITPTILSLFGCPVPEYMASPVKGVVKACIAKFF